ncbi:MAG: hypothetical protein HY369_05275 [Candidatus Aenigmarchaeota archaeon]|nr:hypothetical protein [Candidatus Aenigmarchaeota archaeon]
MHALVILVLLVGLLLTVAVSGCTSPDAIQSDDEAQETLQNVSVDVGQLEDALAQIDQSLG